MSYACICYIIYTIQWYLDLGMASWQTRDIHHDERSHSASHELISSAASINCCCRATSASHICKPFAHWWLTCWSCQPPRILVGDHSPTKFPLSAFQRWKWLKTTHSKPRTSWWYLYCSWKNWLCPNWVPKIHWLIYDGFTVSPQKSPIWPSGIPKDVHMSSVTCDLPEILRPSAASRSEAPHALFGSPALLWIWTFWLPPPDFADHPGMGLLGLGEIPHGNSRIDHKITNGIWGKLGCIPYLLTNPNGKTQVHHSSSTNSTMVPLLHRSARPQSLPFASVLPKQSFHTEMRNSQNYQNICGILVGIQLKEPVLCNCCFFCSSTARSLRSELATAASCSCCT